jgi:circadian clock protein KaiB
VAIAVTDSEADPLWRLTLYVSGASPRSAGAIDTVRRICDEELAGRVELRIVDVREHLAPAISDDIVAVPTLVKRWPPPLRKLVGNLADADRVRAGLNLGPVGRDQASAGPSSKGR